jgi:hypothetical protein
VALAVYSVLSASFFFYLCTLMIRLSIVYLIPTYPTRLVAIWETTQAQPFDLIKLLSLVFEVLWRTLVLCGLSIFAYRLVKGIWSLLKFLVRTLSQTFMKVLKLEKPGVEPLSSSSR